ncbi:MAG TPA: hypothetical protein PKD53_32790 [Chloroflexaceae bacterium]|nr:hypothetical protein [Chloroflexaceae bacterium]
MTKHDQDLESMSCDELLRELARLAPDSDAVNAEVATPERATPAQEPQAASLVNQRARMDRISELLKAKNCTSE